jgi:hypothetical protein
MGADPGHHEHRSPSTIVPTEASGCRSTVRRSIARLVPQPGQKTSSQSVSGDQRGADGGGPQHVAAGGQAPISTIDNELCLKARGAIRLQLGGAGLDVEPSCPDTHRASIMAPASGVGSPTLLTARCGASLEVAQTACVGLSRATNRRPCQSW